MCNYASFKVSFKSQYWKIDIEVDTNEVQILLAWLREVRISGTEIPSLQDSWQKEPKMLRILKNVGFKKI